MITEIIATILFWVGVTSVASALMYIPKIWKLYYIAIILGNVLILLTSPLMIQSEFTISLMTLIFITAQIKAGRNEAKLQERYILNGYK
jgi:hypothetical protein